MNKEEISSISGLLFKEHGVENPRLVPFGMFQSGDRDALELWSQLQLKIPSFFQNVDVKPSLLHGDLWGGNAAEVSTGPGKSHHRLR